MPNITFETVAAMKASTELGAGMICETLGFHKKGDGGGARYAIELKENSIPNGMDIIAIGNAETPTLIARYIHEGKPVNVLQFGAWNYYPVLYPDSTIEPYITSPRNDSVAIQRAIDYTIERLPLLDNGYITNSLNTIIIPAGNYTIKDQINMPPYMQIQLDGSVQFQAYITPDRQLYKYNGTTKTMDPIIAEANETTGEADIDSVINQTYYEREVFAKYDISVGDNALKTTSSYSNEYYVYKRGIFKICQRFTETGAIADPYNGRYIVSSQVESEVFSGNGTLTIQNKILKVEQEKDNNGNNLISISPYICGIEVGSTEEYIRTHSETNGYKFPNKPTAIAYNNLRFSKIKLANCYVGFLTHAFTFYSNVIKNSEFFQNTVAFQFGINGETEEVNTTDIICCELNYDSMEMNHFRDCLFTGNKIDVNLLLSGSILNFNSCHFDFDNCIFRAAYRTLITMANCHIEGIGKALGDKYFPDGVATLALMNSFKSRAENNPLHEFVGIMYARPTTKFNGIQMDQKSYANLSIKDSHIVENNYMPWSIFNYYNSGTAESSDGHKKSNLHLENITYGTTSGRPVSFLTTADNGIVHSGFLVSEFPETAAEDAFQNVPVVSRDSKEWGSFSNVNSDKHNHRFLSNRTLENKYPYFQNVTYSEDEQTFSGMTITVENNSTTPNFIADNMFLYSTKASNNNTFVRFDSESKCIEMYGTNTERILSEKEELENVVCHLSFNEDTICCKKGDVLDAALVTNKIVYNTVMRTFEDSDTHEVTFVERKEPVIHSISFVELDHNGEEIKEYKYSVPYTVSLDMHDYYDYKNYPSTSTCKHIVHNKETERIKMIANICVPATYGDYESTIVQDFRIHALLVEKNK